MSELDPLISLFQRAVLLPEQEREALLADLNQSDPAMSQRLRAMIAADLAGHENAATPGTPMFVSGAGTGHLIEKPGDRLGPFKLLEVIGEGGFGIVYLAERREPFVQRVALKVIKPGMDTKAVLVRFEQERQALGVMNHPNVAKIFDAGATSNGRPYFVMEHVAGEPITEYCNRHRLTIRQRLELFVPVCEAVQHAHHKGIIHRDLKPNNILVSTSEGRISPKVIDFGIAKAMTQTLTEHSIYTARGGLIGTPEYMSPEQAEMGGIDIDTRTDVYSLGVLLYELLAGVLPFDGKMLREAGNDAIRRIIREKDAPKPSTRLSSIGEVTAATVASARQLGMAELTRELRRELDWIPLKALRKDRNDRYATPMDLAKDIERYLKGESLEAGPEAVGYRLRKLARRHKGPVMAVSSVLLAALSGLAGILWYAADAGRQALRADDRAAAAARAEVEQRRLAESETKARETADAQTAEAQAERLKAVKASETIEANSYVANIEMAGEVFYSRQFDRVRQRLDAAPERLRGWEWHWLNACADNSLAILKEHTGTVRSAAFSPDGTRIVTASHDNTARVWDAATGASIAELRGHTDMITSAVFSPAGTQILTSSQDNTLRMWDATTGARVAEFNGHTNWIISAAFSPDGTRIVSASGDSTARVWDAATGTSLAEFKGHASVVTSAAFSPEGTRIVTASDDGTGRVWDVATGTTLAEFKEHTSNVYSASFSPDGTRIVTASHDRTARMWNAVTGASIAEFKGHTEPVVSAAFSPDGTRIVTASRDRTARVWDAATGASVAELKGHTKYVDSAAFSPDGTRIVTASEDNTARVWDAATDASFAELKGHTDNVYSTAFSPDGTRIVTASHDHTARVWDAATGASMAEFKGLKYFVNSAAFSPDGTRIVSASDDNTVRVWNAATGASMAELKGHTDEILSAAFSPDGTRIVTSSRDSTARVWDAATGASLAELKGHFAEFSPDGTRIVMTSVDYAARVWDAPTGTTVTELRGHTFWIWSVSFSSRGTRVVTASRDRTARVWDAATGASLAELKGHTDAVVSAAFSPDGTRVVTASRDRTARVWDAATGASVAELKGHTEYVDSAAFSPDGTRIVTASYDNTVRVWDAATGASLAELKGHSAAFSPDGTRIVTASDDKTARVWDSVPYRERFPAIQRARAAAAKMAPIVQARLKVGESIESLRTAMGADTTMSPEERTAALVELQRTVDRQRQGENADR